MPIQLISYLQDTGFDLYNMREWLSGGASPCQGEGRGFDSRLALFYINSHSGFNPDFFLPSEAIGNKI